ncbi:GDP-L-fucose synthase family protein [Labilibaculum euxinus]|uniref:GDP-L-fucose synthase n=1 Tax=Labilibaculum euxinus TaxID=2686357 RepID=A0A7M4DAG8_9BACT|nr:GDP-L-fucose synthase [Labilibaculum euxinus]MUP39647.1 NAD-dependent epimerase/dehydratase family protein [Labilibaculum euxinus]MVB08852.1 NAD-dependent epimerase/dehydratase family protein [Labilibaculum euxinus]
MKIFLTGGSGLVGQNLKETKPGNIELLTPGSQEVNLLNYSSIIDYLNKNQPDIIIHAAGIVGGIQANIANPVKFLCENTEMGNNILKAALEADITKVINLGSSCIYPKDAENPLKEDFILKGELEPTNEGYAIAKIYALRLCEYINKQYSTMHYKTLIPCNLYGRWDKFDPKHSHMIPAVIRKIHLAKKNGDSEVEIWGDGSAMREFMYAGDLAEFIWYSVNNFDDIPDLINVGLGYDHSILDYYEAIKEVIGFEGKFKFNLDKPVGMKQKLVSVSKLESLGWKARHSLMEGIEKTYQFYLEKFEQYD